MNIIETFQNYAEKNHFSFSSKKPDALEFMYISSDYRIGILRYEVQKNRLGYVMSVYLPIQVDGNSKDEMLKISELTAKINYDLRTTTETFELNWETGALRFKCMLEDFISESDAEELVKRASSIVNTYAEQFLSIIFGNAEENGDYQDDEFEPEQPDEEEEISRLEYDSEIPKIPEENGDFDLQRFLSDSDELEDSEVDFDEDDVPPNWGDFNEADLYVDDDNDSDDNDSYLDEDSYIDDSEDENSYADNSEDDDEGDSDSDNVDIVL